jgi:lipopolysaccharide transport system permease protein
MVNEVKQPKPFVRVIKSTQDVFLPSVSELWAYRDLVYYLTLRNIGTTYRQTVLGPLWVLIQPIATTIVFTFIFGSLAKLSTEGIPATLYTFAGLIPWTLFAGSLTRITSSLSGNAALITKVYFPRMILPIVGFTSVLFNQLVVFGLLILAMIAYGRGPNASILWLPWILIITTAFTMGVGLIAASMNVRFRDVGNAIDFSMRLLVFFTPIAYSTDNLSPTMNALYQLNPLSTMIQGFRASMLGLPMVPVEQIVYTSVIAFVVLLIGSIYFTRTEMVFADVI